jgi:hypothetical protein
MALQRDTAARVWGTAGANTSVALRVTGPDGTKPPALATADAAGKWAADLPAHIASSQPHTISLACKSINDEPIVLMDNVLFGDVFGCHGQSNSECECGSLPLHILLSDGPVQCSLVLAKT